MYQSGRLTLIKTTLATIPVYSVINLELALWLLKAIEKVMKGFLWTGTDEVQGGKYLVASSRVQWPLQLGGLGIPDFRLMDRALMLRWLWLSKTNPTRLWLSLPVKEDSTTKAFFLASTTCILRDGESMLFWTDPWLEGRCIGIIMSELLDVVLPRQRA
jgi:hypothetical protein